MKFGTILIFLLIVSFTVARKKTRSHTTPKIRKAEIYAEIEKENYDHFQELTAIYVKILQEDFKLVQATMLKAGIKYNPSDIQFAGNTHAGSDILAVENTAAAGEDWQHFFTLYHESFHGTVSQIVKDQTLLKKLTVGFPAEYAADLFAVWITKFHDEDHHKIFCIDKELAKYTGDLTADQEHPPSKLRHAAILNACKLLSTKNSKISQADQNKILLEMLAKIKRRRYFK